MERTESNNLFLTDPYRYAYRLANLIAPEYEYNEETGDTYQIESHIGYDVFYGIQNNRFRFDFTKEDYYANTEIQNDLKAMNIDCEAFWHSLVFLDAYSYDKFSHSHMLGKTKREIVDSIISILGSPDASIIVKNRKSKLEVTDSDLIEHIHKSFDSIKDSVDDSSRVLFINETTNKSFSERISFEAHILIDFFKVLYASENSNEGKQFRNPLLLISRLLYFTGVANNESYLVSSDTLKGILKSYPNPGDKFVGNYF